MTLLIMAAGNGSRYGALKQFDPIGPKGEYLFEFSIYDAINCGFNHIVFVTKEQFVHELETYLYQRLPKNIKIDVIAQNNEELPAGYKNITKREKPWGTAHAIWVARNYIKNEFIIINADDYYGRDAFEKSSKFIKENSFETFFGLVPYTLKDTLSDYGTVSRGICQVDDGFLKEIDERIQIKKQNNFIIDLDSNTIFSGEELTSMNLWIANPSIFAEIESQLSNFLNEISNIKSNELYIPIVLKKMIAANKAKIKLTEASSAWFGITYSKDKEYALNLLKTMTNNKKYPSPLWKK